MKATVEAIGPQKARQFLKLNDNFRRPNKRKIAAMTADMKAKKWEENGHPIQFYSNGKGEVLRDGQNRLQAIIDSGTTQKIVVVRNIGGSVFVDLGEKRTLTQHLAHEGVPYSAATASVISNLLGYEYWSQQPLLSSHANVSHSQRIACFERNKKRMGTVIPKLYSHRSLLWKSAIGAVLCNATVGSDYSAAKDDFIDCLATGAWGGESLDVREPTYLLRELQLAGARHRARLTQRKKLALVIKAWNLHRGQELLGGNKLRFVETGPTPDSFPKIK